MNNFGYQITTLWNPVMRCVAAHVYKSGILVATLYGPDETTATNTAHAWAKAQHFYDMLVGTVRALRSNIDVSTINRSARSQAAWGALAATSDHLLNQVESFET